MQQWVETETQTADFNDDRLDARCRFVLDRVSLKPSLSIPAAHQGNSETQAAYRFFNNPKVTAAKILQPHRDATIERMRSHSIILVAQDTTEIDLTRAKEKVGGPLNSAKRYGLYVHPLLAMTPDRVPLGVIHAKIWSRDPDEFAKTQTQKKKDRKAKSFAEKESYRWLTGYEQTCDIAKSLPDATVVSIADSEGDIYECLLAGRSGEADFIIRGCQDRAVWEEECSQLMETLKCKAILGTLTVRVTARPASSGAGSQRHPARAARTVKLSIRSATVQLRAPYRPDGKLENVLVHVVWAREEHPPAGEEAIEWVLATSLPVTTFAESQTVLEYYCCRWEIEIYFRVLKSGCGVEKLQLEKQSRFEVCLAMYLIVAWRVLHVLMMGREHPEWTCDVVFSEAEWKSVYVIVRGKPAPLTPPKLGEFIEWLAELGGYLNRKGDGPPGPKAIWIGLQRMSDFVLAWNAFTSLPPPIVV
jgi:hypothetical protein